MREKDAASFPYDRKEYKAASSTIPVYVSAMRGAIENDTVWVEGL